MENEEVVAQSRIYQVTLEPHSSVRDAFPIMEHYIGASFSDFEGCIDGFRFLGSASGSATTEVGGLYLYEGIGARYIFIKNCVFENNFGKDVGALRVSGKTFIDNCVFINNKSLATSAGAGYSAGAVLVYQQDADQKTEVEFYNCVFSGNISEAKSSRATGTIVNYGTSTTDKKLHPLKAVNCTFFNNQITGTGTNFAASINNAATYSSSPLPVVILNSILYSNPTTTGKEVRNISVGDVEYRVTDGTNTKDFTRKSVTYTAIHDATIGGAAGCQNITLSTTVTPKFANLSKLEGKDGTYGTGDDGLNLSITSALRGNKSVTAFKDGLPEYDKIDFGSGKIIPVVPYYRETFSDVTTRIRMNRKIDDLGAYEKHISIMCVGDNNTLGWTEENKWRYADKQNNYRYMIDKGTGLLKESLKKHFNDRHFETDFVGSINSASIEDIQHEGYSDKTIDWFYGTEGKIVDKINNYQPNIILFLGGSTDIANKDITAQQAFDKLYKSGNPSLVVNVSPLLSDDVKLIISTLPPVTTQESKFIAYNLKITTQTWGSNIGIVDIIDNAMYNPSGSTPQEKFPQNNDETYLLESGYQSIALKYFNAINNMN